MEKSSSEIRRRIRKGRIRKRRKEREDKKLKDKKLKDKKEDTRKIEEETRYKKEYIDGRQKEESIDRG